MRIHCPECQGVLSIAQNTPGEHLPRCHHCEQTFRLKISDQDPPRVSVASVSGQSDQIPERLGGYRILRLLGRGAMGAVYEAKQLSLDRLVALKTIRGRLVENPTSLARFAREAYAAAQLSHHNVVQIYDFGEDRGLYFFSMEWVRGGTLDQLIRSKGAIDPKRAASYTLQAARGLQFAHRNGMVHRDIKPANLLLSEDGVVKIADLGLVKIPDAFDAELDAQPPSASHSPDQRSLDQPQESLFPETGRTEVPQRSRTREATDLPNGLGKRVTRGDILSGIASGTKVTMQGTAVGTPAFMAPEQGLDAANVDHRADIYSLGCTLFCMLTGHPPFAGSEISEVMQQHAGEPLPRLRQVNARVPEALQRVVDKATAKRPSDRYATVSQMIQDLESFLGIHNDVGFSPSKGQADAWESIASAYWTSSKRARQMRPLFVVWSALCLAGTVAIPFLAGLSWWMLGPSIWLTSIITSVVWASRDGDHPLVGRSRAWLESMSWIDWLIGSVGTVVGSLITILLGWWPGLLLGVIIGGLSGTAHHFGGRVISRGERSKPLRAAAHFVRDLRIDGADESGLRQFIARYSGQGWPALFEDVFGYDAWCQIREQVEGDPSFPGPIPRPSLRDKLCAWLAAKTRTNLDARDQRRLASLEARGLAGAGLSPAETRARAWQIAAAIMENARRHTPVTQNNDRGEAEARAVREKRARIKAMLADARSGRYPKERDSSAGLKLAFSGQTRLLAGCLLLACFVVRGQQEGIFEAFRAVELRQLDIDQIGSAIRETAATVSGSAISGSVAASESAVLAPPDHSSLWLLGIAGMLMSLSAFVSGWKMTPFAVVATVVILLGPSFGMPPVGPLSPWLVSLIIGLAIYLPGIIFGEDKR